MSDSSSQQFLPISSDLAVCLLHQMARLMSKLSVEPCDCQLCEKFLIVERADTVTNEVQTAFPAAPSQKFQREIDPIQPAISSELSSSELIFPCQLCGTLLASKQSEIAHMRIRHNVLPKTTGDHGNFKCHACSATFGDKVQLNSHYRQTHVENSVKIFVDETELIPTVEVRPESPELFECPVCHRVYRQQEPFAKHLKSHSTGSAKRGNPKEDEIESKPKRKRRISAVKKEPISD